MRLGSVHSKALQAQGLNNQQFDLGSLAYAGSFDMHTNFEMVLPEVLKHEGGFVDHPRDPGGATNKGITIATFRAFVDPDGSVADLRALTTAQAGIVYKAQYWDKVKGDDLPSGLDYAVFDFAVNSGPSRAAKYLQRIVGVAQDGAIGAHTLAAVSRLDVEDLIQSLCDERLAFMKRIRGGSLWQTFGRGWQRRVDEVLAKALGMVDLIAPQIHEAEPDIPEMAPMPEAPVEVVVAQRDEDRAHPLQSTTIWAQVKQWATSIAPIAYGAWTALQEQDPTTRYIILGALAVAFLYILHLGRHIINERLNKWADGDR